MNRLILSIALLVFGLGACVDHQAKGELENTKRLLEEQRVLNNTLRAQLNEADSKQGQLMHYVFLDIKENISEQQYQFLVEELKKLSNISGVKDLKVGRFENMEDDRALGNRDINFEMRFENKMDYYNYQQSKAHIKVREMLSPFLERAPLTYDYLIQ